jgi:hypothetical protein
MVSRSERVIDVSRLEYSRSGRDAAIARAHDAVLQEVLSAAREDVSVTQDDERIRISASLMTLSRKEFEVLTALLRAHDKGYGVATLMPLLDTLAGAFRR